MGAQGRRTPRGRFEGWLWDVLGAGLLVGALFAALLWLL
jgi:hypothetical protein